MTEQPSQPTPADGSPARSRYNPDPIALTVGIICLGIAVPAMIGDAGWLPDHALRWFVVGAAVLAGIAMIGGTVWESRRHNRS